MQMQSANVAKEQLEIAFLIANCHRRQVAIKDTVSNVFYQHLLIVKSTFDYPFR